jgi:hypothetical protein
MKTIDVDADLLRRRADAAVHAALQTERHLEAEYTDVTAAIMDTLADAEPYAYTLQPKFREDGSVQHGITTTWKGVWDAYEVTHHIASIVDLSSPIEIRGDWYTFHDGIGTFREKASGEMGQCEVLVLFPIGRGEGITGELFWARAAEGPQAASLDLPRVSLPRRDVLTLHERFLDALRAADVGAVVDCHVDGIQTAVRDYVDDTGTLVLLDGKEALRAHYLAFFDKFDVVAVDLLCRVVQDWYVFAEVRLRVRVRKGADVGAEAEYHTAEFSVLAPDGRVLVRTGHGTDLDLS